ncbi:Peptidase cysteine/serine trypsin-like protein [Lasiodiplodia theobromae]|nr:Peptidase cysteine/serine trypsin-like protein [Lasiodiplodia theobromae]
MSNLRSSSMAQGSNGAPAVSKTIKSRMLNDEQVKTNIVEGRFRVGWPRLVPQPTRTRLVANQNYYIKDYEERLPVFTAILSSQGIIYSKCCLVERKAAGTSHSSYLTLLVEASSREGTWCNAVLQLVRVLETIVINHDGPIHVEIIERGLDDPRVLPVGASDAMLPIWQNLAPSVIQTLSEFPVHWKLLSLVKIGYGVPGDQTKQPVTTVLVEAWDADEDIWELEIVPRLSALIADTGIPNLEIWQAYKYSKEEWCENVSRLPERTWWEKPLRIGDGLGPWGSPSTGTLGGIVIIEDLVKGERTKCLLTNSHVVRNCPGLTSQSNKALKSLDIVATQSDRIVNSPTESDVARKIKLLQTEIKHLKMVISHRLPGGSHRFVADRLKMVKDLEDQVRRLSDNAQFTAGCVRALSGFQNLFGPDNDKSIALDWALVQVCPSRPVNTQFSRDNQTQGSLDMPFWTRWGEFERWKKISSFKSGNVLKVGRATGWTSGGLNYARAWLNVRSEECGTVVECMRVENPRRQWHPFSVGGDQGSMIFDASDGACVGLLFSGDEGQTYGLITPIEDVFHSIEEITGCKVVLPRLVS